jgi:hypothetical protein
MVSLENLADGLVKSCQFFMALEELLRKALVVGCYMDRKGRRHLCVRRAALALFGSALSSLRNSSIGRPFPARCS